MSARLPALLALLAFAGPASAVPVELSHQGRLLDGAGTPFSDVHTLDVALYDTSLGGAPLWVESIDATFFDGYYGVTLGADGSLDDGLFAGDELWLGLSVDGGAELPRVQVASTPFARRAGVATDLEGGVVDAVEIRVGGETVIDADGRLVGEGDGDTLADLPCGPGDVAVFTGVSWVCQPIVDADTLAALECSVGEVAIYDGADWVCAPASDADTLAALPCGPGETVVYDGGDWVCAVLPGDTLASLPCSPGEFAAFDGARWTCAVPEVAFAELLGLPGDLADGDDDTLGALECGLGQIPALDGLGRWTCATDRVLSDVEVLAMVEGGPLELAAGTRIGGETVLTGSISWAEVIGKPPGFADGRDDDTLAEVSCAEGEVLAWLDGTWTCLASDAIGLEPDAVLDVVTGAPLDLAPGSTVGGAPIATDPVSWGDLVDVPADLLDGDADSWAGVSCPDGDGLVVSGGVWSCTDADELGPDADAVRGWVAGDPIDLAAGSTIGGAIPVTGAVSWDGLAGIPADLADGMVSWAEVDGVPADLRDGDSDSFASTACSDGEVLVYSAADERFLCGVLLASDTLAELGPLCSDGDRPVYVDATGDWDCGPDAVLSTPEVLAMVDGADIDLGAGATIGGAPISTLTIDDAVAAIADGGLVEGALPFNGLDEVSNGILSNQFVSSSVGGGEAIPDNNPIGVRSPVVVPDVGTAEWLTVSATVENSDLSGVEINLYAPDGTMYGLFEAEEGTLLVRTWPDPSPPLSGDLTEWVGRNPAGTWELEVIDTLYLDNTFDGSVVEWSVDFQYVADGRVALDGDLEVADSLSVDADLSVGGDLYVAGNARIDGDLSVGGGIVVGDTDTECTVDNTGTLRWTGDNLQLCTGSAWLAVALLRDGVRPETAGRSCLDIKGSFPASLDGTFWIDPNGGDTADAFEVECDMSTDGGGWLVLEHQKPEGYFDLSYDPSNNINKCGYDGYTIESDADYVHDSFTTEDGCPYEVDLTYSTNGVELDVEQLEDLRAVLSELYSGSQLVAGDCDSDGHEPGWEAYAIAADGTEVQLTTGTAGNAVWVMDVYADVGDLDIDYLLPASFRLSDDRPGCNNGGGVLAGWTSGRILVR